MLTTKALGLSAAIGGMLAAITTHAPLARADDPIAEMFDNVQLTISLADNALGAGAAAFAGGDIPDALNFDLAGVESLLFGPSQDLFVDSVDILTNNPLSYGTLIGELQGPPVDWADALTQVQGLLGAAHSDFVDAAFELAAGDYGTAAGLDAAGADLMFLLAPNELVIGAAEALFGF